LTAAQLIVSTIVFVFKAFPGGETRKYYYCTAYICGKCPYTNRGLWQPKKSPSTLPGYFWSHTCLTHTSTQVHVVVQTLISHGPHSGFAAIAYLAMLSGQGWTPTSGCRQFFYARYIDYFVTTNITILLRKTPAFPHLFSEKTGARCDSNILNIVPSIWLLFFVSILL
jgi:bacteriorhodopsin